MRATALPVLAVGVAAGAPHLAELSSIGHKHPFDEVLARRAAFAGVRDPLPLLSSTTAAVSLTASPAHPTSDIANITVAWSGVSKPESTDWIAQYCVGDPIGQWQEWSYVTADPGWASGSGSMPFTVFRQGCDLEFRLYRDPSPYTYLGTSNPVSFPGGPDAPFQVHVAYGSDAQTTMTVSWTTNRSDIPSVLQVGTAPGVYDLPNVTADPGLTYLNTDLCQAPANTSSPDYWTFPGYFHHARVSGLTPNTRYYVRPSQGSAVGQETSWVTGKTVGADVATRFVVYADMYVSGAPGAVDTALRVTDRLNAGEDLDFLLHVGDLGYALGRVAQWNEWMGYISPYASRLPYMVSIGNHEYDYTSGGEHDISGVHSMWDPSFWNGGVDSQGECGVPTALRFAMPGNGNGVFWYSFEVGNVHIAMISSEHDPSPTAPMGRWLAQDFAGVDRSRTPWLLLGIHRPFYETEQYEGDYNVAAGLRAIVEPLLLQYKVDVVLAGHYHSFMRTCQVANSTCTPGAPVHYTTGAAGASLDDAPLYPSDYVLKYDGNHYGYSIVTAPNATAMRLQWFWNQDNSLQDDVWIYHD